MSKARNLATLLTTDGSVKTTKYADEKGGVADFVASGTLPNGSPVVLKSDGTVEVVNSAVTTVVTTTAGSIPAGSAYAHQSTTSHYAVVKFDPFNAGKFVLVFQDTDGAGYAVVGTITGTAIAFTGETRVSQYVTPMSEIDFAFDPNTSGKFVVVFKRNNQYGTSVVGTLSGTSLSFSNEYPFTPTSQTSTWFVSISFDPNTAGKFIVVWMGGGSNAIIGTVSGTSISYGSGASFNSNNGAYETCVAFDPNTADKCVIVFKDANYNNWGRAVVGTITGTSIAFSSERTFINSSCDNVAIAFDPSNTNKFIVAYRDAGSSFRGGAVVGTLTSGQTTYGTPVVFSSTGADTISIDFEPDNLGRFVLAYRDNGNSGHGTAVVGTISGTTMTLSSPYVYNSDTTSTTNSNSVSFDPNNPSNCVIAYRSGALITNVIVGTLEVTTSVTEMVTNLTATNFIGTTTAAYTDTQTATVTLPSGVSTNQTGLTPNSVYYAQVDGTLATTADTPSVEVGRALSSTSILIKGI